VDNPASDTDARLSPYAANPALQTNLDAAWRALQLEIPDLVTRIQAGQVEADSAGDVVISATLRVLRNPGGVKSDSGAIDDYSETATFADFTQDLYFTAAELRRLQTPYSPTMSAGSMKYT